MNIPVRASPEGLGAIVTGVGRNVRRSIALRSPAEGAEVMILVGSNREDANGVAEEVCPRD